MCFLSGTSTSLERITTNGDLLSSITCYTVIDIFSSSWERQSCLHWIRLSHCTEQFSSTTICSFCCSLHTTYGAFDRSDGRNAIGGSYNIISYANYSGDFDAYQGLWYQKKAWDGKSSNGIANSRYMLRYSSLYSYCCVAELDFDLWSCLPSLYCSAYRLKQHILCRLDHHLV